MSATNSLLPLADVTDHLRIVSQTYVGVRPILIDRIVGSVDRSVDFDRLFRPKRRQLKKHVEELREAFSQREAPPISVFEASDLYFVSDGHHRVALARADGGQFIDAEITALRLTNEIHRGVDLLELIHTDQNRWFTETSGLLVSHPEANITFSRPIGYAELMDILEAHAYELSKRRGQLVGMPDASADWYENVYALALEAINATKLPTMFWFKTASDTYLWTHYKLRELRTMNRSATWADAAVSRAAEPVSRNHVEIAKRERRNLLPRASRTAS